MSEIKRAQLIPLGNQKEQTKSSKEPRKTVRISVVLPQSTEDTCPEYNYKDELAAAKKLERYKESGSVPNGLPQQEDPFVDDDDDVRRIAKQMEEKYGTGISLNKKKRKDRKDDYADIGMGYDESDSFIDNTDGYDEMIPQNVTTLLGGFYINSGALEFKTDDEANSDFSSSSSEDESAKKTSHRKRIIESSDETDRENKTESSDHAEKKRKLQNGGNGVQPSIKKKLFGQNQIYIKKRRLIDPLKKTVKELLREKREDLDMSIPSELNSQVVANNEDNLAPKDNAPNKKSMSIANVTDVIESVVKASGEEPPSGKDAAPVENKTTATKVAGGVLKSAPTSSSDGESSHDTANISKVDVKLPENLSPDIMEIIATIKGVNNKGPDVKNFFTPEVNHLILRLERKSKCLGKPSKMKVYEHLAYYIKCKTEYLIRRAKVLVLDDEQKKLKGLLSGLQTEINKIMPGLLENHEKESQRVLQKKFSHEGVDNDDIKSMRMPKRRFQWNDVTKKLLKDILMMKKRCLLLEGKNRDNIDAQMLTFLKSEIQVLWPEGWMSMNALNKIYTTYADTKRLLNNSSSSTSGVPGAPAPLPKPPNPSSNPLKNLSQSFNNSNLSITPIVSAPKTEAKANSITSDITVSKANDVSINLSMKSLPEPPSISNSAVPTCDIIPATPKKELESKLKVKSQGDLLKPSSSSHLIKKTATSDSSVNLVKKTATPDSSVNLINDDSIIIIDERFSPPVKEKSQPPIKSDRFSPHKDKAHGPPILDRFSPPHKEKTHGPPLLDRFSPPRKDYKKPDDSSYGQVIDLSDKNDSKIKNSTIRRDYHEIKKETTISPVVPEPRSHVSKHHEISITPSYSSATSILELPKPKTSCAGDDIQKVMEDLKVLQKMSSPKKSVDQSPTSSAVSVIAVNKSFAPKQPPPVHSQTSSTMQRIDYTKNSTTPTPSDYGSSFQDEFQKQLFSALNHITTSSNKSTYNSIDRFPHISSSGPSMVTGDKYFQSSNNNYAQSSNGHKSSTSAPQSGTYSILDDMFANLLTQYGYSKEAAAPKSQPK